MNKKGLTLIELLVVIAIISILFVLLIPQISNAFSKAKETGVMTDFKSFEKAAFSFLINNYEKNVDSNIDVLNESLDSDLKFKKIHALHDRIDYKTSKKSPFGSEYNLIAFENDFILIQVWDSLKKTNYFMISYLENGEVKTRTEGFQKNIGETDRGVFGDFSFIEYFGDEISIYHYKGEGKNVTIPEKINNKKVTYISSFSNSENSSSFYLKDISSLIIPNTIKQIGREAFIGHSINELVLPSELEILMPSSFSNAPSVDKKGLTNLTFNGKLRYIFESSFYNNKLTSVNFPINIEVIGYAAFYRNNIENLNFNEGLSFLGSRAFTFNKIKHLTIPNSLKVVPNGTFSGNLITSYTIKNPNTTIGYDNIPSGSVLIP